MESVKQFFSNVSDTTQNFINTHLDTGTKKNVVIIGAFLCIIILIIVCAVRCREKFTNGENYVYTNSNEIADLMDYSGGDNVGTVFENIDGYPASTNHGVQQISQNNAGDSRMYKWTANPQTQMLNDAEMKSKYENMYMLGSKEIQENSLSNMTYSTNCCPNQYMPQFLQDKKNNNCRYANKFIANGYMGQNIDGSGCACMTPKSAEFIVTRGGNTTN
jgi:hypothetical protein